MCFSMGMKCGACLAKWNGKTWDDSYKCMLSLKTWSLKMNDQYQLCLEGRCDMDIILEVCIPITNRLTNFWVTGQDVLIKFCGILNRKNLPDYIVKKFSHGIPKDWKEVSIKWGEYIQRGKKSTFCWDSNSSPARSPTSLGSSRSSRRVALRGEGRNAKLQEKTPPQRKQTVPPKVTQERRDSGNPTSTEASNLPLELSSTKSSESAFPWLPPDKYRDINKWIHSSCEVSPDPASDVGNESANTESYVRLFQGQASFTSQTSDSTRCTSDLPTTVGNAALPRVGPDIAQSTPVVSMCKSRAVADAFSLDVSAIADISHSDASVQYSNAAADVFRKPTQCLTTKINSVKNDAQSIPKVTGRTAPKTHHFQTLPLPSEKISELPGNQIVQRENSVPVRPRRKHPRQKIERWRPILGVDGNLKVQGYLLLGGDMTACQILTTNTVIEWGNRIVRTSDRREFELVGDSYGKIPDDLKKQLLKPMKCEVIIENLKEFQSIKEDVTRCLHLAPPPAPRTINTTRSGRLCRPCAPYWLNRSDWGAEYDLFYEEDKSPGSTSRTFQGRSRDVRTSSQNPMARNNRTVGNQALSLRDTSQARRCSSDTYMKSNVTALPSTSPQNVIGDASGLQNGMSLPRTKSSSTPPKRRSLRNREKQINYRRSSSSDDLDWSSTAKSRALRNSSPVMKQNIDTLNQSFKSSNRVHNDANLKQTHLVKQNQMMMPSARLQNDCTLVHFSPSRIKVSYMEKSANRAVHSPLVNVQSVTSDLNSFGETPKRPSRSPVKRPCFPCCEVLPSQFSRKHSHSPRTNSHNVSQRKRVPDHEANPSPSGRGNSTAQQTRTRRRTSSPQIPDDKTSEKSCIDTGSKGSVNVMKTRKRILYEPRILLRRLDTRKFVSGGNVQKNKLSESVSAASNSVEDKRKRNTQESEKEANSVKERKRFVKEQQKTIETSEEEDIFDKTVSTVARRKSVVKKRVADVGKKKVTPVGKGKTPSKANQNNTTKVHRKSLKANGKNKTSTQKSRQGKNQKNSIDGSDGRSNRIEDNVSVCSETSVSSSVGPSASVIFAMNAELPTRRGAPRTLKERRMRDEELQKLGDKLASRETLAADDDPMANLIAAQKFASFPEEWCCHENFLRKNRKRRRPSSSEDTASPSRSGVSDNFGNEDATSSVATPQLLMRQPDQKQVQSYLQRHRALMSKAQRPTRQLKKDRPLLLPAIDYSAPFRKNSDSSDSSSEASDSEWEG